MTSNSEKKDKSLAEFVLIIVLVGIMMAIFIKLYNKNESQFRQAGFASIAQTFNSKVHVVHAQWMMDNQPNIVKLTALNTDKKQAITVNNAGWIDVENTPLPCQAIWQLIIEAPLTAMKLPISAIELHTVNNLAEKGQCRYVLLGGSYFQYNRVNGKVSKVIKPN